MTESVLNYILLINKKNNIHTKINQKVDFKVTSASGFDNMVLKHPTEILLRMKIAVTTIH